MNFLFACGGTAGHINPALAIAAEMRSRVPDAAFLFAGAGKELENRLIPGEGYELVNIHMSGLRRRLSPENIIRNVKTVMNLSAAGEKAESIIRGFRPDAVIGTGGYICYPVLKTAAKMGIATFIHESNAVPGLTTKLLSACADKVLVSFPGLERTYRRPDRVVVTGTPVRVGFAERLMEDPGEGAAKKPLVVSFWGSLGAQHMNELMPEFINLNLETRAFDHIHATGGKESLEGIMKRLKLPGAEKLLPQGIEIRDYIENMPSVMSAADLILCRAGGSTIAELTALGKPALIVPSPYVTNGQQIRNAEQVGRAGGALLLSEKECSGKTLFDAVTSILGDSEKMLEMAAAQRSMGYPDAAKTIAGIILDHIS